MTQCLKASFWEYGHVSAQFSLSLAPDIVRLATRILELAEIRAEASQLADLRFALATVWIDTWLEKGERHSKSVLGPRCKITAKKTQL